jgi:hypothetical protein
MPGPLFCWVKTPGKEKEIVSRVDLAEKEYASLLPHVIPEHQTHARG